MYIYYIVCLLYCSLSEFNKGLKACMTVQCSVRCCTITNFNFIYNIFILHYFIFSMFIIGYNLYCNTLKINKLVKIM